MLLVHAVILLFTFLSSRGDIHLNVMCTVNAATYIYIFFSKLKILFFWILQEYHSLYTRP